MVPVDYVFRLQLIDGFEMRDVGLCEDPDPVASFFDQRRALGLLP